MHAILFQAQRLARSALASLAACAGAFGASGDIRLVDLVLEDGLVGDLLEDVGDPQLRGGFQGASARVEAAAGVLEAVRHTGASFRLIQYS